MQGTVGDEVIAMHWLGWVCQGGGGDGSETWGQFSSGLGEHPWWVIFGLRHCGLLGWEASPRIALSSSHHPIPFSVSGSFRFSTIAFVIALGRFPPDPPRSGCSSVSHFRGFAAVAAGSVSENVSIKGRKGPSSWYDMVADLVADWWGDVWWLYEEKFWWGAVQSRGGG